MTNPEGHAPTHREPLTAEEREALALEVAEQIRAIQSQQQELLIIWARNIVRLVELRLADGRQHTENASPPRDPKRAARPKKKGVPR